MALVIYPDRSTWAAARKTFLGASEAAAVLGANPHKSALAVYTAKAEDQHEPETRKMRAGLGFERSIAELWAAENDYDLETPQQFAVRCGAAGVIPGCVVTWSMDKTPLAATPDFFAEDMGGTYLVETKNVTPALATVDTDKGGWKQGPPLYYIVQVQMQLGILRENGVQLEHGLLVAYFGGDDIREYVIEHDAELFEAMRANLCEFWKQHVATRTPPDPDRFTSSDDLSRAYRRSETGKQVEIPMHMLVALRDARQQADIADAAKDAAEVQIKALMGDAEIGTHNGAACITWREQVAQRAAQPAKEVKSRPFLPKGKALAAL